MTPLTSQVTSGMAAMLVNEHKGHGTIKAPPSIDPEADAAVLRKAMKGMGGLDLFVCRPCLQVGLYIKGASLFVFMAPNKEVSLGSQLCMYRYFMCPYTMSSLLFDVLQ